MSGDPIKYHHMPARDIQSLLALVDQRRRRSDGLKRFQCRLTIRAYINIFLWSILKLNFMNTGQDTAAPRCCCEVQLHGGRMKTHFFTDCTARNPIHSNSLGTSTLWPISCLLYVVLPLRRWHWKYLWPVADHEFCRPAT